MVPLPWPVTATVITNELSSMQEVVNRWHSRFSNEDFIRDLDNEPEALRAQLFTQFINEMKVCASKSATLVEVLG